MTGFIARTSIPFGPLTVSFGYGPSVVPVPPVPPGPPPPPEILDRAGPSFSPLGLSRGASRLLTPAFVPVTQTTSATKGRLERSSSTTGLRPSRRVIHKAPPSTGTTTAVKGHKKLSGTTPRAPKTLGANVRKKRG